MYSVSQIFILSVGRESNKKPGKFWGNIEKHSQGTCLFWTPESSGFQDDNRELPTVDDEQPAAGTIYTYKETEVIFLLSFIMIPILSFVDPWHDEYNWIFQYFPVQWEDQRRTTKTVRSFFMEDRKKEDRDLLLRNITEFENNGRMS